MKVVCAIVVITKRLWEDCIKQIFELMCFAVLIFLLISPCLFIDWLYKSEDAPRTLKAVVAYILLIGGAIGLIYGAYLSIKGLIHWVRKIKQEIDATCEVEHD